MPCNPHGRGAVADVQIRYIVKDIEQSIAFYCQHLGFKEEMNQAPAFAMLSRGPLRLVLSAPVGGPGGGQQMVNGVWPEPGGWNRFPIQLDDLRATVDA